jgi:acyl-coenzyme A synthetase/AMP-(fatty) acid ligase
LIRLPEPLTSRHARASTFVEERFAAAYAEAMHRSGAVGNIQAMGSVGLGNAIDEWAHNAGCDRSATSKIDAGSAELACILYTSGSTGRHKGWMMCRAAITAHSLWSRRLLRPRPGYVFANHAQFTGMSLDIFRA